MNRYPADAEARKIIDESGYRELVGQVIGEPVVAHYNPDTGSVALFGSRQTHMIHIRQVKDAARLLKESNQLVRVNCVS